MTVKPKSNIKIKLKAYDHNILNISCQDIIKTINRTNATAIGPIFLPTHRRIYCVLRSPHVDKDSREHFELRTHKRVIEIKEPSSLTIDALMQLNLPAGIDIEVKL